MPLSAAGTATINYAFEDRDKNRSTLTLYAPSAAITENVETWATGAGATMLQALTDARIVEVSVIRNFRETDMATLAPETSDVERKGLFSFEVDGGGVSSFRIPSFLNSLVIDGTNTINTTAPAVVAFQNAMVDAGVFDLVGLGNFRGDKLIAPATPPRKVHRGSMKG